jgi:DNA modification methylase
MARSWVGQAMKTFHDGKVTLHAGDCLDVIKAMPENSIDAVVTDPPYHLTSIVKRFGAENAKPTVDGVYNRSTRGFMGKQWDGGDIAFRPELWTEVLRVLKPGGHMVCFGGTRTYHRMVCAIEDAGFEVRDQLAWVYGSGFPKSHDVSKGIDRRQDYVRFPDFAKHYAERRKAASLTHAQVCALGPFYGAVNHGGMSANWESGLSLPTVEQWNIIAPVLGLPQELYVSIQREEIGSRKVHKGVAFTSSGPDELPITLPATDAARQWQGWGTALKPAWEPICLARKPLSEGTVAANVLRWGTGALNIDGCRIPGTKPLLHTISSDNRNNPILHTKSATNTGEISTEGRWPANLCHDGSAEVLAGFPDVESSPGGPNRGGMGYHGSEPQERSFRHVPSSGSAARFFASFPMTEEDLKWKVHANDAEKCLFRCHQPNDASVPQLAADSQLSDVAQNVKSAGCLCDSCAIVIAQGLVALRCSQDLEAVLTQESINEHSKLILSRSLALYAAGRENTDTILTIPVLRTLLGSVRLATEENTSSERSAPLGKSAPRFLYTSKAAFDDRLNSKHPTVKPVDLMQWLVRLVCPKGAVVLDPFAGTGTTGEAAFREGCKAVLIEREAEYLADIERRMELLLSGPDERSRKLAKSDPHETLPLFA